MGPVCPSKEGSLELDKGDGKPYARGATATRASGDQSGPGVVTHRQGPSCTRQLNLLTCVLLGRLRLKLVADDRLITHNLRLVAGFDHVRLTRPDLNLGAVLMSDPDRPRLQDAQMFQLTAVSSHYGLDALCP
jgi:hypothetical protein